MCRPFAKRHLQRVVVRAAHGLPAVQRKELRVIVGIRPQELQPLGQMKPGISSEVGYEGFVIEVDLFHRVDGLQSRTLPWPTGSGWDWIA